MLTKDKAEVNNIVKHSQKIIYSIMHSIRK